MLLELDVLLDARGRGAALAAVAVAVAVAALVGLVALVLDLGLELVDVVHDDLLVLLPARVDGPAAALVVARERRAVAARAVEPEDVALAEGVEDDVEGRRRRAGLDAAERRAVGRDVVERVVVERVEPEEPREAREVVHGEQGHARRLLGDGRLVLDEAVAPVGRVRDLLPRAPVAAVADQVAPVEHRVPEHAVGVDVGLAVDVVPGQLPRLLQELVVGRDVRVRLDRVLEILGHNTLKRPDKSRARIKREGGGDRASQSKRGRRSAATRSLVSPSTSPAAATASRAAWTSRWAFT